MNRKLHNTTMALIASSSLFVLGLLIGVPTAPTQESASAQAATFDADRAVAVEHVDDQAGQAGQAGQARQSDAAPHPHVRRAQRQSLSMPFFSFAPRG